MDFVLSECPVSGLQALAKKLQHRYSSANVPFKICLNHRVSQRFVLDPNQYMLIYQLKTGGGSGVWGGGGAGGVELHHWSS